MFYLLVLIRSLAISIDAKRFRVILSAIINFVKFREEELARYQGFIAQSGLLF